MKLTNFAHPRGSDAVALEKAQSLWCAGDYTACLRVLEEAAFSAQRFLLAARAAYALRRYDEALTHLAAGHTLFTETDKVESDALSAVLHEIKGNARESDLFYERAATLLAAHPSGRAANMLALRAWMRDDLSEALRRLRMGEASRDASVRAQAMGLHSWVYATRREFAQQAKVLTDGLAVLAGSPCPDTGRVAEILQALSGRCREMYLPEEFKVVCDAAESMRWTSDLEGQECKTLRHIALANAMQGQYVTGLRQLQRVTLLARTPPDVALSLLDCAWIALASGERNAAEAYLRDALDAIDRIDWEHQVGAQIGVLLLAAEIACAFDPQIARGLLETYDAVKGETPVLSGVRHDRSFDPVEAHTRALVLAAMGQVGPARKFAKKAFRSFAQMGYDWRAARCALFLYESGCGDTWLAAAKDRARNYPRSFIGAQLERIDDESNFEPLARLTPRQRDVVRLLVEGDTVDRVAAALKTSPGTVRVHLKHIHRTLGVRNRVELLRAVRRSA